MQDNSPPRPPHIYEARLKTVIRSIRLLATSPLTATSASQDNIDCKVILADYEFVLRHFAAVGHAFGAMQVYAELARIPGIQLTTHAFTLCLRSLAHRLSLPMYRAQRSRIIEHAAAACRLLLRDMRARGLRLGVLGMDAVVRVLKETADKPVFGELMKATYGIDLDNPDRPACVRLRHGVGVTAVAAVEEVRDNEGAGALPFSTTALNTTLDILGRFRDVAKLVQAFEVLTQPLPSQASNHFLRAFEDEDDDVGTGIGDWNGGNVEIEDGTGSSSNSTLTGPQSYPSALPNSTTYAILLKHISRAGHATFSRHYLLQASRLDREADRALRSALYRRRLTPPDVEIERRAMIPPVQFALNRLMILSVLGLAKRSMDMELLRFVGVITRRAYRRKGNDIVYYSAIEEEMRKRGQQSADAACGSGTSPVADTPFDVSLHLRILHKDLDAIATFYTSEYLPAHARMMQRIKERLGRRVWADKDVFLRTHGKRMKVSRPDWAELVNFKMNTGDVVVTDTGASGPRGTRTREPTHSSISSVQFFSRSCDEAGLRRDLDSRAR